MKKFEAFEQPEVIEQPGQELVKTPKVEKDIEKPGFSAGEAIKKERSFMERLGGKAKKIAGVLVFVSSVLVAEKAAARGTIEKGSTPAAQVERSQKAELESLLSSPEYQHLLDIKYLFSSPFVRIESTGNSDHGVIKIVKKGIGDGEPDRSIGYFSMRDGKLTAFGGKPITKAIPVPLEEQEKDDPTIKILLDNNAIKAKLIHLEGKKTAEDIYSIEPHVLEEKETIPLAEAEPDYNVGISNYVVDAGDKKIATLGLANCVAITIYNPETKRGGVAHFDPNQEIKPEYNEMIGNFNLQDPSKIKINLIGGWSGNSERAVYYLRELIKESGLSVSQEDILGENIKRSIMLNTADGELIYLEE